jgi:hypothetical protein
MGERTKQDLAGLGGLLESSGHVDRIPGREGLALRGVTSDHLARVHARPHGDPHPALALELLVEGGQALAHLGGRPHCPQGGVLVHGRDPEHSHDRIADELLHRAAVLLEHPAHLLEVALHDPAHHLGIRPLAERRRARNVCEDDGYCLASLRHAPSV